MSTRIYNGYKIKNMTMVELNEFVVKLRELLTAERIRIENVLFSQKLIRTIDDQLFGLTSIEGGSIYYHCYKELKKELAEGRGDESIMTAEMDTSCSICFFPMEDCILATFYSQKPEYKNLFESMEEVQEYAYWNNSDEPEGMSEEDWKKRGEMWDKVFEYSSIPSRIGICVELNFSDSMFTFLESEINNDSRLNRIAFNMIFEEEFKKMDEEEKKDRSNISKVYRKIRLEKERLLEKTEELRPMLFELTKETVKTLNFSIILEEKNGDSTQGNQ